MNNLVKDSGNSDDDDCDGSDDDCSGGREGEEDNGIAEAQKDDFFAIHSIEEIVEQINFMYYQKLYNNFNLENSHKILLFRSKISF